MEAEIARLEQEKAAAASRKKGALTRRIKDKANELEAYKRLHNV